MIYMCPELIKDAKQVAAEMLKNGNEIQPVKFGDSIESVFVTTNHKRLIPNYAFELEGKTFFIGWGLKQR